MSRPETEKYLLANVYAGAQLFSRGRVQSATAGLMTGRSTQAPSTSFVCTAWIRTPLGLTESRGLQRLQPRERVLLDFLFFHN